MKFYVYEPDQIRSEIANQFNKDNNQIFKMDRISIHEWHSHACNDFLLQLKHLPQSIDPDFFLVPLIIKIKPGSSRYDETVFLKLTNSLPYYKQNKNKHVFFFVGDDWLPPKELNESIIFMQSCHQTSRTLPLFYTSPLCEQLFQSPSISKATYCITFQGNPNTHLCRKKLIEVLNQSVLKCRTAITPPLPRHPHHHSQELQKSYLDSIQDSIFVACPRGMGLNSIRFYETLAAGRIPILIADKAKLPPIVNWDSLIIRLPENQIDCIHDKVARYMQDHNLEMISEKLKTVWKTYFCYLPYYLEISLQKHRRMFDG